MKGRASGGLAFALVACSMMLLSTLASPASAASSTTTSTSASSAPSTTPGATPAALLLSVIPPELPADGGSYPAIAVSLQSSAGKASLALNDTVVYLTSSQEGVGTVTSQVTILRGTSFAVANFTTSTTPGVTSISASSSGLSAASTQVTSLTPSGFATALSIIPVPGSQLANPSGQGTVLVETLDSAGNPAKASSDISVTLSSSNNNVVSLPSSSLTLASGSVLSSVPYDVGASPGTATITGSSSGFKSGAGSVTVQGASPSALSIIAQPDPIATSTGGRLVVTLTDPQGNPAPAPSPVSVTISSSNTTVVTSDQKATIAAGQIYAVASFTSGASPGTANLTASSPGLTSDFALVTVEAPVQPLRLELAAAPDPVLADRGSYDSVVVMLTDASGNPADAQSGVSVTLTSSNSAVGNIVGSLSILSGSSYAVATFSSTYFVGSTTITASAQNLQSASTAVSSYGPIPTKVVVQALPSRLPADGGGYQALEVMLEDANGLPAVAPVGVSVQLASSSTDIASVNSTVVIAAGQSYVLADVETTISPGTASVTATSSGFQSSSTTFTTVSPAPSQLGVYVAPANGIQSLGRGGDAILAVQLQDSTSSPARARQDTQVVVTSSNSSMIAKPLSLDIPAGADYAWALVSTVEPGSSVLTASTGGLSSGSASLSELSLPVSVTLTSSAPVVAIGTPASVQLQVQVMGSPLQGANVTFTATSGSMIAPTGVTDPSGRLTDTFIPTQNGVAVVTALVQDPVIGNQTAAVNILVTLAGAGGTVTHAKGLGVVGTILPIVLVVVIVVIIALGARRILKSRSSLPDEEADST
ncbi:MAG TPA: Ig-like domain-containing protein [Nitrososphaerales archaeon]|nr:Ig-like domain-containing protein [Nitrososphaerales archaeon]